CVSSRSRHTRLVSDWSSDVCSSDLLAFFVLAAFLVLAFLALLVLVVARAFVAHVERVEQIMHGVAEAALVLDQLLELVELAAGRSEERRVGTECHAC